MASDEPESLETEEIIVDEIFSFREVYPKSSFLSFQSKTDWLRIINDLNNQLTIVTGATDTVLAQLNNGLPIESRAACQEHLRNVLLAVRRVAEVVAQLAHIRIEQPAPPVDQMLPGRLETGIRTLLLVEDEDQVRLLARTSLLSRGYRVLDAADGKQALAEAARHAGPIHLLVTDFELDKLTSKPEKMTGQQLADYLRPLRPELKVAYISGVPAHEVRKSIREQDVFIQKPFSSFEEFAKAVDSALAK
jgi:CheY-like chemotaxis protein